MERNDGAEDLSGELIRNITFARMVERMRALPHDRAAAGITFILEDMERDTTITADSAGTDHRSKRPDPV